MVDYTQLYQQALGTDPTPADLEYWNSRGASGLQDFYYSAEADPRYGNTYTPATDADGQGGAGGARPPSMDVSAVTDAVSGLGSTIQSGFGTTNQNISGVDQNVTGVGQAVNTGFTTTNQNLNTGFNAMTGNFNTLNDQNVARDTALNSYLATLNTGVQDTLGGLGTNLNQVGTNLNQVGSNLDTYYGDLSNKQAGMTGTLDNLTSDFGDYRQQYNTDVNSANNKRAEIMESVGGTATQTQNMIGQQGANMAAGSGGGQPSSNGANPQQPNPIMNTVSMARDALSSNQNMAPQAAAMLSDFVSAFSPDGQFIPNGPDANGIPTIRNMNPQGVMQIAKQNAQGQYITSGVTSQQQIQSLIQAISMPQGLGAV